MSDACAIHGYEHWSVAKLMTGTYSYCERCAKEKRAQRDRELRHELAAKGYEQYRHREAG